MSRFRTSLVLASLVACLATACAPYRTARVHLFNAADRARPDEPIFIQRQNLGAAPGKTVAAVLSPQGKQLPFQTDDLDGDGQWDELFFLIDLERPGTLNIEVRIAGSGQAPPPRPIEPRVAARIDGNPQPRENFPRGFLQPAWESELFGYRGYNAAQIDYFGKIEPGLTLSFFLDPPKHNHHQFWPEKGMDCLAVGHTMGGHAIFVREPDGAIARPWTSNAYFLEGALPNDARHTFQIVANGPLRAIVRETIDQWETPLGQYACEILYEIHAGARHTLVTVEYTKHPQNARVFQMGAGIGATDRDVLVERKPRYLAAIAKDYPITGETIEYCARAMLTPHNNECKRIDIPLDAAIADTRPGNGPNYGIVFEPGIVRAQYAFIGAWSRDGAIQSPERWTQFIDDLAERLATPPAVRVR